MREGRLPFVGTPLGRLLDADAIDALARDRIARQGQAGAA